MVDTFDALSAAAAKTGFGILGATVTYTASGGSPVAVTAIIDHDVTPAELIGLEVTDADVIVSLLCSEVVDAKAGAVVDYNGKVYTLRRRLMDDGIETRYIARVQG